MRAYVLAAAGAAAAVAAVLALAAGGASGPQLSVDALVDRQSLFTTARVSIRNDGGMPATGARISFGGGQEQELGTIMPGQSMILTPPEGGKLHFVTVTADGGILVTKSYREPPKMVGMMGS